MGEHFRSDGEKVKATNKLAESMKEGGSYKKFFQLSDRVNELNNAIQQASEDSPWELDSIKAKRLAEESTKTLNQIDPSGLMPAIRVLISRYEAVEDGKDQLSNAKKLNRIIGAMKIKSTRIDWKADFINNRTYGVQYKMNGAGAIVKYGRVFESRDKQDELSAELGIKEMASFLNTNKAALKASIDR